MVITGYAAAVSLPGTLPFPGPDRARPLVESLVGQRWNFFTGDARGTDLGAYLRRNGDWVTFDVGSSSSLAGSGGFSRRERTAFDELTLLDGAATRAGGRYQGCEGAVAMCADRVPAVAVPAAMTRPLICGDALLSRQATPSPGGAPTALRVLRIEVTC